MSLTTLDLAKALINKPSVSPDDAGCIPLIQQELESSDFSCFNLPFEDVSNLWATHGKHGPTLALLGHTDVVPTGDESHWLHPPFTPTIVDDALYGRGACDMKGALAAMVVAATQFVKDYPEHPGRLAFLLTSDEEAKATHGTKAVVQWLQSQQETVDYALVGEPSSSKSLGDTLKIGRRGSLSGTLTIKGKQGHVAYPHLADNPIHTALKNLHALLDTSWDNGHPDFPETSLQFSNIEAGTGANNVIPGDLMAMFNLRYNPSITADRLIEKFENILKAAEVNFEIAWHHSGSPFITSRDSHLIRCTQQAIKEHCDTIPELSTSGGTSDGRFIAVMDTEVVELGPLNQTIHQVNEWISVTHLNELTKVYYTIIKNCLNNQEKT